MTDIYNTTFEVSLRILIIMNIIETKLTIERIAALDFITIYGRDFGVSKYNLHGDNNFRFSEYASKRKIVAQSIKELVLKGYIKSHYTKKGFNYSISPSGISFCNSLNNDYAEDYAEIVKKVNNTFHNYSDRKLISCINEHAVSNIGGKKQ